MDELIKYWIWLSEIKGLGSVTCKKLLEIFVTPKAVYNASKHELLSVPGVGNTTADAIISNRSLGLAERIFEKMAQANMKLLTIKDPLYPAQVKSLTESPVILYYRGTLREQSMGVAIVGARRCTDYGKKVAKEAAEYLANNNIPVISGMAKGIDGYAHTACIKAEGYTLAFLGHGVDNCYPKEHQELMEAIIAHGAVISEYPPGTPVKQAHFPKRNYLISAWAYKLLVVEAGVNSGALITAKMAKEQEREVFVVPNNIYSKESYGTNRLISNGANIYLAPYQLLVKSEKKLIKKSTEDITIKKERKNKEEKAAITEYTPLEIKILSTLNSSQMSIEQLAISFPNDKKSFLETLSIMELEGKVKRLPGGMICRG